MSSDSFLEDIRRALLTWKQNQLRSSVKDDQDTGKLNVYLKQTAVAYDLLMEYLKTENKIDLDHSLDGIIAIIGKPSDLSREERMLLKEYLFRDLIEYPFTYNTSLINSFDKRNVLDTKIIPNK